MKIIGVTEGGTNVPARIRRNLRIMPGPFEYRVLQHS